LPRTERQQLGDLGQRVVCRYCKCPKCKKGKLKQLIGSFKCADVICDFCGFVAQVKAITVKSPNNRVLQLRGGAWGVQEEKIKAGIYHPLYIVKAIRGKPKLGKPGKLGKPVAVAIEYIAADFLTPEMYVSRTPLGPEARRAGWQGFVYDLRKLDEHVVVQVWPSQAPITSEKPAIDATEEKVKRTKTAEDSKLESFG
jgi:hypothetical protein